MTTKPTVSIIIPCYNAEPYVGEAIESALDQTYPHREVIVIDDGSTDGSLDVLRSFGERIRWETGPNQGGCAARNRGMELARGEFIQFLDADDLLDAQKVERQLSFLREDTHCLVFCDARVIDHSTGESRGIWGSSTVPSDDAILYVLKSLLQTAAPLHWKMNLLAVGGWREDLPAGQDPDLHMRLACAGLRFRHLQEVLYTVRRVAGSVSDRHAVDGLACWQQSALAAYCELDHRGELTEERAEAFAGYFATIGRRYLRYGMKKEAQHSFDEARLIHSDGGVPQAYGSSTRKLRRIIGPFLTERLVGMKRRLSH